MSRYDNSDYDDMSYELDKFLESHKPSELLKLVQAAVEWGYPLTETLMLPSTSEMKACVSYKVRKHNIW